MKLFVPPKNSRPRITLGLAAVVVLLTVSCSKKPDQPVTQLGEIQLVANTPKHIDLGGHKECDFVVTSVTNDILQLDLIITTRSFSGVVDATQTQKSHLKLHPGQKCTIGTGEMQIEFTPVLSPNNSGANWSHISKTDDFKPSFAVFEPGATHLPLRIAPF